MVLQMHTIKIRDLPKIIGCLVASFQAVTYGPMYYRHLEQDKILALRMNYFNLKNQLLCQLIHNMNYNGGLKTLIIPSVILEHLEWISQYILMLV